jgi:hypothetical protein
MFTSRKDLPKYTLLAEKIHGNLVILSKKNRVNQCHLWLAFQPKTKGVK